MANINGKNYKIALVNNPVGLIPSGEQVGRVRCMYDEVTLSGAIQAVNDIIFFGAPLQAGARVLDVVLKSPSLGATGILEVGYAANGIDVADLDGFIDVSDAGGQAVYSRGGPLFEPGIGKKFEAATQVTANFTEASAAGDGKLIQIWVYYILD